MTNKTLSAYRNAQIQSMSQVELVIMLYQGATRFLHEAVELMDAERYDKSWPKLDRARKIVIHLLGTLNQDAGDLTGKFASLYAFVIERISVANAQRDSAIVRECIDILTPLKEGWEDVAAKERPMVIPPVDPSQQSAPVYDAVCVDA